MNVIEWFTKLGHYWSSLDPNGAANLFSKDVIYYESVFEKPCANWEEVFALWKLVPKNQKDVSYKFEIISTSGNLAIANWQVSRVLLPSNKTQTIDGIFIIKLNRNGLCNYLKQWRTIKES